MTSKTQSIFLLPEIPLREGERENRMALATGSVSSAMAGASSMYNGHPVDVEWLEHSVRGKQWVARYHWGQSVTVGRGALEQALTGALREYNRGARGAMVFVRLHEGAPEAIEQQKRLCVEAGMVEAPLGLRGQALFAFARSDEARSDYESQRAVHEEGASPSPM